MFQADLPGNAAMLVMGYLFGSIPFGLLLTKLAGAGDLRAIGSGNIGATNVLRTGRKGLAAATLLLDALKATVAILIAYRWGSYAAIMAGLGAFIGHLYPVWLRFKGGKGVATYIGCLLGLAWPAMLVFAIAWLAVAFITRYSSASALAASVAAPLYLWFSGNLPMTELFAALSVLLWFKHWPNIERLMNGTETRIGAAS